MNPLIGPFKPNSLVRNKMNTIPGIAGGGASVTDPTPWATGLYEFWPLDEGSAASNAIGKFAVVDVTASGSPGVGGTGRGTAYRTFDGSTQGFSVASSNALASVSSDFAVSAWFYPTAFTGNHQIAGSMKGGSGFDGNWNWFMYLDASANLKFATGNAAGSFDIITVASGLSANTQYHCAVTWQYSSKTVKYTLNGGAVGTTVVTNLAAGLPASPVFTIGGEVASGTILFKGRIKCVAKWNGAGSYMSDALLQGLYNGGVPIIH